MQKVRRIAAVGVAVLASVALSAGPALAQPQAQQPGPRHWQDWCNSNGGTATPPVTTDPPVVNPPVTTAPPVADPPAITDPPVIDPPVVTQPPVIDPPVIAPPVTTDPPVDPPEEQPVTDAPRPTTIPRATQPSEPTKPTEPEHEDSEPEHEDSEPDARDSDSDEDSSEDAPVVSAEVEEKAFVTANRPAWCDIDWSDWGDKHHNHHWWSNHAWWHNRDHDASWRHGRHHDHDHDRDHDRDGFANCSEARDAGAAPIFWWEDDYADHLDRDDDGIACEWGGDGDRDDDNGDSDDDSSDDSSSDTDTVSVSDYSYNDSILAPVGGVATGGRSHE